MSTQKRTDPVQHPNTKEIELINSQVQDCALVLSSRIHKITIVIEGKLNEQRLHKTFFFSDNSIVPIEIYTFFQSYATRLTDTALAIVDTDTPFVQLGDNIISMQNFLKDYSAGVWPSINYEDYIKVRDLKVAQVAVITINNSIQSIKRIK